MKILAVNSSNHMLSVAVNVDGNIVSKDKKADRQHNQFVLNMIELLMAESGLLLNQIDAVAFGDGPGSFTGLRISAGVAQGIAFGIDAPVVPVSCMAAIAQKQKSEKIVVAIDAKRDQIHWGCFTCNEVGIKELYGEEHLTGASQLQVSGEGWFGAGNGFDLHSGLLLESNKGCIAGWEADQVPTAFEIARIGEQYCRQGRTKPAHQAIPSYRFPYFAG